MTPLEILIKAQLAMNVDNASELTNRGVGLELYTNREAAQRAIGALFTADMHIVTGVELEHLRTERDALAAAVDLVRDLHHADVLRLQTGKRYCHECADNWPCPTSRALPTAPTQEES